jgi:protein-S-isoprenylcysteine O-methyltransferase Ste14
MKFSPFLAVYLIHASMLVAVPALLVLAVPTLPAQGLGWFGFRILGALQAGCGVILYFRTIGGLTVPGKGTPAIWDPPRVLVNQGHYGTVRNPMYAAVVLIAGGEALVLNHILVAVWAVALWGGFHLFVTLYEEPTLRRTFGASYEKYCKTVPRWLPAIFPRST